MSGGKEKTATTTEHTQGAKERRRRCEEANLTPRGRGSVDEGFEEGSAPVFFTTAPERRSEMTARVFRHWRRSGLSSGCSSALRRSADRGQPLARLLVISAKSCKQMHHGSPRTSACMQYHAMPMLVSSINVSRHRQTRIQSSPVLSMSPRAQHAIAPQLSIRFRCQTFARCGESSTWHSPKGNKRPGYLGAPNADTPPPLLLLALIINCSSSVNLDCPGTSVSRYPCKHDSILLCTNKQHPETVPLTPYFFCFST